MTNTGDTLDVRRHGYAMAIEKPSTPEEVDWQSLPAYAFRNLRPFDEWVTYRRRYATLPLLGGLATVQMAWDVDHVYLAFHCPKLFGQRQAWSGGDGVEVFLQPQASGPVQRLTVSDDGGVVIGRNGDAAVGGRQIWTGSRHSERHFELELAIPHVALAAETPRVGDIWHANFCRTARPLDEPTAWSYTANYANPAFFGTVEFAESSSRQLSVKGSIDDYRSDEPVLIESVVGISSTDNNGAFEIRGLTGGKASLRFGSFYHQPKTMEICLEEGDVSLSPVSMERLPDEMIRQRENAAAQKVFHFTPRYEDDPIHRDYQGCPSLCVLPDGGLMATYTCYSAEDIYNAIVVDTSYDGGCTWKQEFVLKAGFRRASWGNLWVDPLQRVWMFHQLWWPGVINLHYTRCDHFRTGTRDWLEPQVLCEELPRPEALMDQMDGRKIRFQGLFPKFINKPVVLSDGTWLAPVESNEFWTERVVLVVSTDNGETWTVRGHAPISRKHRQISEPMVIERHDKSLWMLIRTPYGIAESVSLDQGRTWREFVPSSIPHCTSRFFLGRLASQRLILVKNGPMDRATGREQMTAFLSEDEGRTWPYSLLLYGGTCSYPDVDQDKEGGVYVVYDHGRKGRGAEILMSVFAEEDIVAGKIVSEGARLNLLVARTGPVE